jgi:hypothetical protein
MELERDRPFDGIPLCAVMKFEFSAYISDQELPAKMFDAMQLHLETCPRCQDDRVGPLQDFMQGLTIMDDDPPQCSENKMPSLCPAFFYFAGL